MKNILNTNETLMSNKKQTVISKLITNNVSYKKHVQCTM